MFDRLTHDALAEGLDKMESEQLRKEFEAWHLKEYGAEANDTFSTDEWQSYQAAAQSRDELIGKTIDAVVTPENCALGHTWLKRKLHQAIAAAAKAQGYGE